MDSSSSSDQYNREQIALRQQKRAAPIKFLIPLIYAPVLPLIRLTLRHKPVLRDRLFTGVLIGAFAHGAYLVYPFFRFFVKFMLFWIIEFV
ncbi:hypothetical protein AgCh_010660 [Apium graveolens]